MNLAHPGNWRIVGRLVVESGPSLDVFECPACFALTREPMDHAEIHLNPPGRCGAEPPTAGWSAPTNCELLAGHAGWHRSGMTEWGARS